MLWLSGRRLEKCMWEEETEDQTQYWHLSFCFILSISSLPYFPFQTSQGESWWFSICTNLHVNTLLFCETVKLNSPTGAAHGTNAKIILFWGEGGKKNTDFTFITYCNCDFFSIIIVVILFSKEEFNNWLVTSKKPHWSS